MKFYPIKTQTFLDVLDAIAWKNGSDDKAIAEFSGFGNSTIRNAINNGNVLSITSVGTNGNGQKISIVVEFKPKLKRTDQLMIVRKYLQNWEFFQILCEFLSLGDSIRSAIRKAGAMSGFSGLDEKVLAPVLSLAVELGVLEREGKSFQLSSGLPRTPTVEAGILTADLDSEMAARLFVANRLGSEFFHSLDKTEQARLSNSVMHHALDPEKSDEDAGKALESYLRLIGTAAGHDLTRFNGLGEIADYLAGGGRTIIHPKHRDLIKSTSTLRNCSAHERDKLTNQPWRKTPEMALANVLWALHLMRSIDLWVNKREQVL
jgi:hypothetical protein